MPFRNVAPASAPSLLPPAGNRPAQERAEQARLLRSERRLIVVAAAVLFAVVAALGPVYLRAQKNNLKHGAAAELTAIATLKLTQLGSWRTARIADVRRLVHTPDLLRAAEDLEHNHTSIAALDAIEGWVGEIANLEEFDSVLLFSPDLQPLTPATAAAPANSEGRRLLARAATGRDPVVSDFQATAGGTPYLELAAPIYSRDGRLLGLALFRADLEQSVFPLLARWPVPSQTGEILLGSRNGGTLRYVAHDGHVSAVTVRAESPEMRTRADAGLLEERVDYRGVPVLGVRRAIAGSSWFLVAKMDEAEAYAGLADTTAMAAVATGATLCAVLFAAMLVWRRRKHIVSQQELAAERRRLEERRQAQSELRRSEEEHRLLFLNHPIPMWLLDFETLRFVAVNIAAIEHYGYSREEFLGMTIRDIRPEGDRPGMLADLPAHNTARRKRGPVRHRKKNGEEILVEICSEPASYAGRPARLVLAQDVTARVESERRLREAAELLDKSSDAIVVSDLGGVVTFWNEGAERVLGWTAAEAVGRTAVELFGGTPAPGRGVEPGATPAAHKLHVTRRSGEPVTLAVRVTLLRDAAGKPSGFLRIATDITEKEALEEKFLRAQRLESIGMLAAGITHDLNNVLAPVALVAGLLRHQLTQPEQLRFVDTLDSCAARGATLVGQILGFVHGISGEPRPLQVRYVIRDIAAMIRETYPKSVALVEEVAKDLAPVVGNPTQVHQVLLNLCVNARDAMASGGTLCLRARNEVLDTPGAAAVATGGAGLAPAPGTWVVIEVADSGTGIAPDVLAKMWDPFFTTKSADKGTGLGLATVRGIVGAHHGFIGVDTEPGHGTTFRIYLPAASAPGAQPEQPDTTILAQGHGEMILLVDDEEFVRETTRAVLAKAGYNPVPAKDGVEAAQLFESLRADIRLVITDRDMPGLDGGQLIQVIRRRVPTMKILVISGADGPRQGPVEPARTDASAFLGKPFTPRALLGCVRQLLQPESDEATGEAAPDTAKPVESPLFTGASEP